MEDFIQSTTGKKIFPLGDSHSQSKFGYMHNLDYGDYRVGAIFSGQKRCPKKGEWYLSGGKITAYQAPNDLGYVYHIAKIVRVKKVIQYKITEELDN